MRATRLAIKGDAAEGNRMLRNVQREIDVDRVLEIRQPSNDRIETDERSIECVGAGAYAKVVPDFEAPHIRAPAHANQRRP